MTMPPTGCALLPPGALRTPEVLRTEIEIEQEVQRYRRMLREQAGLPSRIMKRPFRKDGRCDPSGKAYPTAESMLLGERVREACERSPLQKKEIARRAGMTPAYLSQILRGQIRRITPTMRPLLDQLQVDLTGLSPEFR